MGTDGRGAQRAPSSVSGASTGRAVSKSASSPGLAMRTMEVASTIPRQLDLAWRSFNSKQIGSPSSAIEIPSPHVRNNSDSHPPLPDPLLLNVSIPFTSTHPSTLQRLPYFQLRGVYPTWSPPSTIMHRRMISKMKIQDTTRLLSTLKAYPNLELYSYSNP